MPFLAGAGALLASTPVSTTLSSATGSAPATLILGFAPLNAPFRGGVLVPTPGIMLGGLFTDALGGLQVVATWPAGVSSGTEFWMQVWIADASGPAGVSATNGVLALTP